MLDLARLREELEAACADAGIEPATLVVWVVDAERPDGATPLAYLQPAGEVRADTVAVFRAVGAARASEHEGTAHRLALWGGLPGIPQAALGPMLRHELEHARRWERSGPTFFAADDLLRAAVRADGGRGYGALPSELEANAASAAYAARTLSDGELAELRASEDSRALLDGGPPPDDVVEATLAALSLSHDPASVERIRRACREWGPREAARLAAGRTEPLFVVL